MYKAITRVEAFNEGQLLIRTNTPEPVQKIASIASKLNEFYIVKEIQSEKIVLQKAVIQGTGRPIIYHIEEIAVTDVLKSYWYAMKENN